MTGAVRAYRLLSGYDRSGTRFIESYGAEVKKPAAAPAADMEIPEAVAAGLKAECAAAAEKMLSSGTDPMEIINEKLIPALDSVGEKFEKGTIFLPQLIQSAGAAQAAFDVIKRAISERGGSGVSSGRVVLCTVKGDIHDIGKNIVKTLLENYGFEVIDLGKDVDYQDVVDAAVKYDVRLVGLSALMTTTLKSMENTIKLLRENNVDCKVVVGGAVLTPEYAEKIGADFYARDAKETVDIARRVYGLAE